MQSVMVSPAILCQTENMTHEEWLQERKKGIGGSDAAAAIGMSKWKSPFRLWLEKTGQIIPEEAGEAAYWGTTLEPLVREEFERRTGKQVAKPPCIFRHSEYPWMLANVDGIIEGENAGLEVKTASERYADEWEDGKIPVAYQIQAFHYMAVMGWQKVYFAVLIGGNQFLMPEPLERDEEIIADLIRKEEAFWTLVQSGETPWLDGSESTAEAVSMLHPETDGSQVELPGEEIRWVEQFNLARDEEKKWGEKKDEAAAHLKTLMGSAARATLGLYQIDWGSYKTNRIDTDRLKTEQPDLYQAYLKTSESRRFAVKIRKGGK